MNKSTNQEKQNDDFISDVLKRLGQGAVLLVVGLVLLPLVPAVVSVFKAEKLSQRSQFWSWGKHELVLKIASAVFAVTGVLASVWGFMHIALKAWDGDSFYLKYLAYWAIFALLVGLFFVPFSFLCMRRNISSKVTSRSVQDVTLLERITRARYVGARDTLANRTGSKILPDGQAEPNGKKLVTAPKATKSGDQLLGERVRESPNLGEAMREKTIARFWVDKRNRFVKLPDNAGDLRAVVVAESGAGKSDFLRGIMQGARAKGWRVTLVDAKGDPEDARGFANAVGGRLESRYNAFMGSAAQICDRLFSAAWQASGDAQHYQIRGMKIFEAVQSESTVSSISELVERVRYPLQHVQAGSSDEEFFMDKSYNGVMMAAEFANRFSRLDPLLGTGESAWSFYDSSMARVVPLNPLDEPEKQVGIMLLQDFKRYVAWKREQVANEVDLPQELFIFDEFAQLTGGEGEDPAVLVSSLMETIRTARIGMIITSQTVSGITRDKENQDRLLGSGVTVFAGRTNTPERLSQLSGTVMQKESSATADDTQTSGRAQHTFALPPQYLREASMGEWFMLQAGSLTPFRAYLSSREQRFGQMIKASSIADDDEFF